MGSSSSANVNRDVVFILCLTTIQQKVRLKSPVLGVDLTNIIAKLFEVVACIRVSKRKLVWINY